MKNPSKNVIRSVPVPFCQRTNRGTAALLKEGGGRHRDATVLGDSKALAAQSQSAFSANVITLSNLHDRSTTLDRPRRFGRLVFVAVVAFAAVFWLAYLPRLAQQPGYAEAFDRVESRGVDPGALFYTDHPRALGE